MDIERGGEEDIQGGRASVEEERKIPVLFRLAISRVSIAFFIICWFGCLRFVLQLFFE